MPPKTNPRNEASPAPEPEATAYEAAPPAASNSAPGVESVRVRMRVSDVDCSTEPPTTRTKGEEYEVAASLAQRYVRRGVAELVSGTIPSDASVASMQPRPH